MKKLKILHVVSGMSREGGGISEVVAHLAHEASRSGHSVEIATVVGRGEMVVHSIRDGQADGVHLVAYSASKPHALRFSFSMAAGLRKLVLQSDIVHVHSNWTFPVWWACHLARSHGRALVMTPHGCLDPKRLEYAKWKKMVAGWLFDRACLRSASVIHVTSPQEALAVQAYLGKDCITRLSCVPCGVGEEWLACRSPERPEGTPLAVGCIGPRIALYLGRLHPLKGVHLLIDAWSRVMRCGASADETAPVRAREWRLVVVGEGDPAYKRRLIQQARGYGLRVAESDAGCAFASGYFADVVFSSPLYGAEKIDAVSQAQLFVLPTYDENFGIVVAEALARRVPVIATKGAPWSDLLGSAESPNVAEAAATGANRSEGAEAGALEQPSLRAPSDRCGWWVDIGAESLALALQEAMGLSDEERRAMGANGRRLVAEKYRWPQIAVQMEAVYRLALASAGKRP